MLFCYHWLDATISITFASNEALARYASRSYAWHPWRVLIVAMKGMEERGIYLGATVTGMAEMENSIETNVESVVENSMESLAEKLAEEKISDFDFD